MKITAPGEANLPFDSFYPGYAAATNAAAVRPGDDDDALDDFLQFVLKMERWSERRLPRAAAVE